MTVLAKAGEVVLCEDLTYPGIRAIAAQLGVKLVGLPMDEAGIQPDDLVEACRSHAPKALYLNPTLQNPTTRTIPEERRSEIAAIARRFRLPIIEDDAYGFIPDHGPAPFAALVPELTWHVAGLAKCVGAGLRAAYVVVPDARAGWPFAAAVRTARETLKQPYVRSHPLSFNLWIELPAPWSRSAFVSHLRSRDIGVVPSDAFALGPTPVEAVRVCLGGPISRSQLRASLDEINQMLSGGFEYAALVI
jgi:DNA-binding transcriptional MocR family regulator